MMGIAFQWFSDDSSGKAVGEQAVAARLSRLKLPLPSGERVGVRGTRFCRTHHPAHPPHRPLRGHPLPRGERAMKADRPSQRGAPRRKVHDHDDRPPWKARPA
ncbi:hypothetical protein D3868_18785 (plasmid) [Azospirillum brasilense]|uniref:Uncharacterized protein n=1 Tax=Azospirillum brasilense TaxID=192 RepID=A0A4D8QV68_AZOBR|nr:hypothetical protein D3868_18785 [Azospirillum brasilense]